MEQTPVTIIGAGPAGLTLALALSRLNVKVLLSGSIFILEHAC